MIRATATRMACAKRRGESPEMSHEAEEAVATTEAQSQSNDGSLAHGNRGARAWGLLLGLGLEV